MIPLSSPVFKGNEAKYLKECVETGWVSSSGPFVDRFEKALTERVGGTQAVAAVNGTAALHMALRVLGVQTGDEVIVSDLTFVAPVNAILYCGASPVFVDAHPATWQIDADSVEEFLSKECVEKDGECFNKKTSRRVRAILPVHILGSACEIVRLVEIARRYRLKVVEDACEGLGVFYRQIHIGTFGDIGVLSFNGNKIVTAGGGGAIVTSNAHYAKTSRYLATQAKDDEVEYIHNEIGYNYRMTNLQAAVGLAQLEQLDAFLEKKRAIARRYDAAFRDMEGIITMPSAPDIRQSYWLYTILLPEDVTLSERQEIVRQLNERGIGCRPLWHPIHALPPYRNFQAYRIEKALSLYRRAVSLPSGVSLSESDQEICIEAMKQIIEARCKVLRS